MMWFLMLPIRFARLCIVSVQLAIGQVWANKMRSILATLGIVIGIASVIAVIGALQGLRTKVLSEFESIGASNMYIFSQRPDEGPKKNAPWNVIRLEPSQFEGLTDHAPALAGYTRMGESGGSMSSGERIAEDVRINGIDPAWHIIEQRFVTHGRPFTVVDAVNARPVCLITESLRDELRLPTDPSGESVYMLNRRFTIIGVVEPPGDSGGLFGSGGGISQEVMVPYETLYNLTQPYLYVIAYAKSPEVADEARAQIRFFLRQTRNLAPDEPDTFGINLMSKLIDQFKSLATGVTAVAGGIVGISLLVGGVGIMNIMLVSVSERTREIGLRKAVGAQPIAILLQFLIESVVLCSMGGLIGIAGGQGLIELIQRIPGANLDQAAVPLWAVLLSLAFSGAVGITFGLFPAIKASRLNPIEALRHE